MLALSGRPPAPGLLLSTWFASRLATGDHVATIAHSTPQPSLTATPSPTFKTLLLSSLAALSFLRLTLSGRTTKSPCTQTTSPRPQSSRHLALFEFVRMPFGLRNAAQTFQRFMDQVLRGLPFCFVYLDDLLIASPDMNTHLQHLRQVFQLLSDNGILINAQKSEFAVPSSGFSWPPCVCYRHHTPEQQCPGHHGLPAANYDKSTSSVSRVSQLLPQVRSPLRWHSATSALSSLCSSNSTEIYASHLDAGRRTSFRQHQDCSLRCLSAEPPAPNSRSLPDDRRFAHRRRRRTPTADRRRLAAALVFQPQAHPNSAKVQYVWSWVAYNLSLCQAFSPFSRGPCVSCHYWPSCSPVCPSVLCRPLHSPRSPPSAVHLGVHHGHPVRAWCLQRCCRCPFTSKYLVRHWQPDRHLGRHCRRASRRCRAAPTSRRRFYQLAAVPAALSDHLFRTDRRHQHRLCSTVHPSCSSSPSIRLSSSSFSSRHSFDPEADQRAIRLAMYAAWHPPVDPSLSFVSAHEDWPPHRRSSWHLSATRRALSAHPRGSCGPTSHVCWLPLLANLCRPLFTLADCRADCGHASFDRCPGLHRPMDSKLWRPGHPHHRPRRAVWVPPLQRVLPPFRDSPPSHHRLPPRSYINGMVERFHRQLKSALRSQPNPADWSENLALVLLGIRSSLKPDLGSSAAELVYGTPLRLPGEFFSSADLTVPDPSSFLSRLRQFSRSLRPVEPRPPPSSRVFYVPAALDDCTHVYVRVDSVRQPLATPYDGPFRVIRRADRVFELDINGSPRTVSIDRLRPAHLDNIDDQALASVTAPDWPGNDISPSSPTRSSRHIHFA